MNREDLDLVEEALSAWRPRAADGGLRVSAVACGATHTAAVVGGTDLYTWGSARGGWGSLAGGGGGRSHFGSKPYGVAPVSLGSTTLPIASVLRRLFCTVTNKGL